MLIRREDAEEVADERDALVMRALARAADTGGDLSATWVRLDGRHRRLRTDRSTRLYYVLEGSATFTLGDEQAIEALRGDVVIVPRGTPYEFWGVMEYLVVNGPAFVEGDDVYDDAR